MNIKHKYNIYRNAQQVSCRTSQLGKVPIIFSCIAKLQSFTVYDSIMSGS